MDCMTSDEADALLLGSSHGIMNQKVRRNPVADDTFIFVPYCTQDLHFGNSTVEYTLPDNSSKAIQHR